MALDSVYAVAFEMQSRRRTGGHPHQAAGGPFVARRVTVRVPATSANLGPGFDCLALALRLRNRFEVRIRPNASGSHAASEVEVLGAPDHVGLLARKRENLFLYAFRMLCERVGVESPPLDVRIHVHLPPSRGLGSSATAVVGGLLAANTMLGGPLDVGELLELAVTCEPGQHADNVAAALLGGLVVTGVRDAAGRIQSLTLPVPPALRAVLFIPDMPMSTIKGRSLLPPVYTRHDATFNLGRVALLLGALQSGRLDLLATAMDDRLHQQYREQLFPALGTLIAAANGAGAHGSCLSGGGSSVLALVTDGADTVREAMERTAAEQGVTGRGLVAEISREGAQACLVDDDAPADWDAGEECGDV